MSKQITFAAGGKLVALVVATGLTVTAAPAEAAPSKVGPVKGLDATISKPAGRYVVASNWDDLAAATSYRVSLTQVGGTVLQSDTVTASEWTATTALSAGSRVTVKVVPMAAKRPGRQTSVTRELPDMTAPNGTFELVQASPGSRDVTINQVELSDDLTPTNSIVRTVNWGDGTPAAAWTPNHSYTADLQAYNPSVTLMDDAGNERVVPLGTVVVGDHTAPTGAFGVTGSGWAEWTRVELAETTPVADNFSSADKLTRTVAWGDGTTDTWTGVSAPTHVYADEGTYTPEVTLVDEAGNTQAATVASTVVVTEDSDRPAVRLNKPRTRRTWVSKWVTLRGKVSDAATGVKAVKLRLVEKRGSTWYAYRGTTRRWVRGGATQAAAQRRTTLATVRPTATSTWSYKVNGLRKGRFVVQVKAVDNVRNASRFKTVTQSLTHN
jgi:hypothetical protein